jgi:hypothetical protein
MPRQIKREKERRLMTAEEAAVYLATTPDQLAQQRADPTWGLPWIKLTDGKQGGVRYDRVHLDALIERRTVRPEPAAEGGR